MMRISACKGDHQVELDDETIFYIESLQTEMSAKEKLPKKRMDMFNNQIKSKPKKFKVSFRDDFFPDAGLTDVNIVENWKAFNIVVEKQEESSCLVS